MTWSGKVDLEDWRARLKRWSGGSAAKAARMAGPRLPPEPMMIPFLMEDIFEEFGGVSQKLGNE